MFEGEEVETEPSQSSCPAHDELLEVMERYLSGHNPPARVSLPFFPDLHAEFEKEWKINFFSHS